MSFPRAPEVERFGGIRVIRNPHLRPKQVIYPHPVYGKDVVEVGMDWDLQVALFERRLTKRDKAFLADLKISTEAGECGKL